MHGHPLSQSGAFFGLDARLAMLVFAVLSVVAGYVAFGRIAIAKQAVLIGELQAYEHALQQYQTDLGTFYLFTLDKPADDTSSVDDITALWDVTKVKPAFRPRWNGPYMNVRSRRNRTYGNYSVFYAQADRKNYCTTDSDCFVWLGLSRVPAAMWQDVNSYYDEGGGRYPEGNNLDITTGRVQADSAADPRTLLLRTIERAR